jgi:hypothetical protein
MVLVDYLLQGDTCPAEVCVLFQQLMASSNTVNGFTYIKSSFSLDSGYAKLHQQIVHYLTKLNVCQEYAPLHCKAR